jgi:hypothetical protein
VELKDGVLRLEFALPIPRTGNEDRGPWSVPVPLFWPMDVARTETTARIWTGADSVQLDDIQSPGWRDLPPEPARQVLPAGTLVAAGSDASLTLRLRESDVASRAGVWVSRGLIRVRSREVGPTEYEARFLVHRWFADGLEIRIPGPLAGEHPDVLVDGVLIDPNIVPDAGDPRSVIVRVPLPESRDQPVDVEVKYRLEPDRGTGETFEPPQLRGAVFDGPVRWHVILPNGSVPLFTDGGSAEQRWSVGSGLLLPSARHSPESLEQWFRTGNDADDQHPGANGDLVVRQTTPAAIRMASVSRTRLVLACSVAVFVLGFGLTRLRSSIAGPLVALVGGLAAAAAVRFPQPVAQAAAAAEPGLAALVLVLVGHALARWYTRRRVTYLPGFARVRVEHAEAPPTTNGTGSVRKPQLGSTGSNGAVSEPPPLAPSGSRPDH